MLDPEYIPAESEVLQQDASELSSPPTRRRRTSQTRRARQSRNRARNTSIPALEYSADADPTHDIVAAGDASPEYYRRKAGLAYRVSSWLAVRTAPLCNAFYDLQMQIGGGVRLEQHRLQLPNFPTGAPALKVAFLSDLHYGPMNGRLASKQAWKLVRDANPDAIFLGGDFLFADERGLPALLTELQRFQQTRPPAGIYACLGNHDYYAGRDTIVTCLEACGVTVLINDAVPLQTPWKGVWIAGVDDMRHGAPNLHQALEKISPDASTLLLAHEPDICADPNLRRCGITLCGHTHGGQVCMPGGDPLFVPSKVGKDYARGLIRHAGQWLYVSRGVGVVGIPMRLFCPPEVAIFEFFGRGPRQANTGGSRAVPLRLMKTEPASDSSE